MRSFKNREDPCVNVAWASLGVAVWVTHAFRVKHGLWRSPSLRLVSPLTEDVSRTRWELMDCLWGTVPFFSFSCCSNYLRQWGPVLILKQFLLVERMKGKRIFVWLFKYIWRCWGGNVRDWITAWLCRQDERAGKLWILLLSWSGTKATELEFVWISLCRQQTHRHCAKTQAVMRFYHLCVHFQTTLLANTMSKNLNLKAVFAKKTS